MRISLAHALALGKKSRLKSVDLLRSKIEDEDTEVQQRITEALKEISGEEAFEGLQEILGNRYIEPSDKLRRFSKEIFEDTVKRMRKNYETSIIMNRVVFGLGMIVVIVGIASVIFDPANNHFLGQLALSRASTHSSLCFFSVLCAEYSKQ